MVTTGFYARLRDKRGDNEALTAYVERVVNQLESTAVPGFEDCGELIG